MQQATEIKPINDIDIFASIVTTWHADKVNYLKHFLTIPEGTEVQIDEDAPLVLQGDLLKGFVLGIELSLSEFITLPFFAESIEDKADKSDAQSQTAVSEPA